MRRTFFAVTVLTTIFLFSEHAYAEVLVFSDDFESNDFDLRWNHSDNGLSVVNGRVMATENGRILYPKQTFSGDLRIEVDIEQVGSRANSGWDFVFSLFSLPQRADGLIRFDRNGIDGAGIATNNWVLEDTVYDFVDASEVNRGTVVFTYADSYVDISFTNDDGSTLSAGRVFAGEYAETSILFYMAAMTDSPRYLDNVRIYAIPEPSTITLFTMFGLVGGFVVWRKHKRA